MTLATDVAVIDVFKMALNLSDVTCKTKHGKLKTSWIVEGFASTTALDHTNDVVTESGLKSLQDSLQKQETVLFNHNPDRPIGKLLNLKVQKTKDGNMGLKVKIEISKSEPKLWQKIKDGTIRKFSWAGRILESEEEIHPASGTLTRFLTKIQAFEVSLVSIPANNTAEVTDVRVGKFLNMNGALTMKNAISEKDGLAPGSVDKSKSNNQGVEKKATSTANVNETLDAKNKKETEMDITSILKKIAAGEALTEEERKFSQGYLEALEESKHLGAKEAGKAAFKKENGQEEEAETESEEDTKTKTKTKKTKKDSSTGDDGEADVAEDEDATGDEGSDDESKDVEVGDLLKTVKAMNEQASKILKQTAKEGEQQEEKTSKSVVAALAEAVKSLQKNQGLIVEALKNTPRRKGVVQEQSEENQDNEEKSKDIFESDEYKDARPRDKVALVLRDAGK